MSIEMDNPQTPLEKADALSNLIEQMNLAHQINDRGHFDATHKKASALAFELTQQLDETETD